MVCRNGAPPAVPTTTRHVGFPGENAKLWFDLILSVPAVRQQLEMLTHGLAVPLSHELLSGLVVEALQRLVPEPDDRTTGVADEV